MEMVKTFALALVLSAAVGYAGQAIVAESGHRWRAELARVQAEAAAARQAADEAARRAEQERLAEERRRQEEEDARAREQRRQAAAAYDPMGVRAGAGNPMAVLQSQAPTATQPARTARSGDYGGLPDEEGVDLVFNLCGACHSLQMVTQQRLTQQRWDHLLDWMVAEQGMPAQSPEDRRMILTYLSRNFAP